MSAKAKAYERSAMLLLYSMCGWDKERRELVRRRKKPKIITLKHEDY